MGRRSDILLVGQTPPPFHGQSVMTGMVFDHAWSGMEVERLRMRFSDSHDTIGEASWVKIWRLIQLILGTWGVLLRKRPRVLYYLPASPNMTPVLRDVIYLGAVRWFFPKVVYHYHAGGLGEFLETKGIFGKLALWVYGKPDVAIDVNVTEPASGECFGAKKNVVVMNGLDVPGGGRTGGEDRGALVLLSVGLICEEKGSLWLMTAMKAVRETGIDARLVMVGASESVDFEEGVLAFCQEHGLEDFVEFRGSLVGEDKWDAFRSADVFVFPSQHPTETFGLVVIEAMGMGLPVVATRWRGIPHVVVEGETALLHEVGNVEEFVEQVKLLDGDRGRLATMGSAAESVYQERYTRERFLQGLEEVFKEVLL